MKENMPQEMSAQEMFEQLGYKLDKYPDHLDYWKGAETKYAAMVKQVCFDLRRKSYYATCLFDVGEIDMPTLRAIQKQIEELGWLDD